MVLERTSKKELRILAAEEIGEQTYKKLQNYLRFLELSKFDGASQDEVDQLAEEINASGWERTKHLFGK